MTKKKGEFEIDDDFNFDDFNFNDNIPGMEPAKDNRKPITKVAGAFLEGVKDTAGSEQFVRRLVSNSLPAGYGKAINTTYEGLGTLRELYDSGVREFQPADTALRSITGKLVPTMRKVLPKGLADKLDAYSKGGSSKYQTPSQGQLDEQTIAQSLGDIFKTQAAADYKKGLYDEAKQEIRDSIDDKKFKLGFKEQQTATQSLQRLVAYQDSVTANYQKKNLELQYRQYFALRDISTTTRTESRITNEFLKAIAKNSALPDIVKAKKMEVMKSMFEHRLFAGAANGIGKYVGNFMPELKKRIVMNGRNAIQGFVRGLTDAHDMASMADSMGMGMGELGGNVAGGLAADELSYHAGKKIRGYTGKIKGVREFGNWLDDRASGVPEKLNMWGRTASTRTGLLGWLENLGKTLVQTYSEDTRVGESPLNKLDQATQFNNHTQKSITEVIPGYLARIFREISWMRTGSDPGLTVYNLDRGTFTSAHQARSDIRTRILHPTQVQSFREASERMINAIDDKGELTPTQRKALQRQQVLDANQGRWLDHEAYIQPGFHINGASSKDHEAIVKFLRKKYNVQEGSTKINRSVDNNADALRKSRESWEDMRRRFPSPTDMLRVYAESGQLDLLRDEIGPDGKVIKKGFLTKNGLNDVVDSEWLYRFMTGDDGLNGSGDYGPIQSPPSGGGGGGSSGGGYYDLPEEPKGPSSGGRKTVYARAGRGKRYSVSSPIIDVSKSGAATIRGSKKGPSKAVAETLTVVDNKTGKKVIVKKPRKGGYRHAKTGNYIPATQTKGPAVYTPPEPVWPTVEGGTDQMWDEMLERNEKATEAVINAANRVIKTSMGHGAVGTPKGPVTHEAFQESRKEDEARYQSHTDNLGEIITKAIDGSTAKLVETLDAGRLSKEGEIQSHTLESIEKLVRYIAKRVSGGPGTGIGELKDADFHMDDEEDTLGDSPEARLVRRLKKWRKRGQAGFHWGKEKASKGFQWATGKAKGFLTSGGSVLERAWKWGKDTTKEMGDRFLDAAGDLYQKGVNHPVLEKAKLLAGEYYDASGKVIRRWSDIKGSVYDKAGNVVVDAKDVMRGFYDVHGRKVIQTVTGKVAALFWKAASMFSPFAWIQRGKDLIKGVGNRLRDIVDAPVDIYVRGEEHPRMKGVIMAAGGYFSDRTKKPVMRPSQIDGIIRDDKGDIVIDLPDFDKGLVNVFGFPVGSLSHVAKRLAIGAFKFAKEKVMKVVNFGKKVAKGAWDMAKNTYHGAVNIAKHGIGTLFGASSEEVRRQTDILQRIYDLLDDRLPGKRLRLGSYQDELSKEHAFESNSKKADAEFHQKGKNPLAALAAWFKSKFGGKKKDDDDSSGGNYYDFGSEAEKGEEAAKKAGKASKIAEWIEKKIPGGKWITKAGRGIGKVGGAIWRGAKALDPTGILSGLGFLGSKAKGLGGKLLGKLGRSGIGGKMKGGVAKLWEKLRGLKSLGRGGKLAEGLGEGAEGLGEAGTGLAEAGAMGAGEAGAGALATTGAAAATGAEAASVAGLGAEGLAAAGAGAEVLGGIAAGAGALLSAPVLLGAAAIAALGYGAYKLYRHFKDKMGPLETYRMAQYGVDKDSPDKYNKIRQLEQLLEPHVSLTGGKAKIQPKSVNLDDMLKIFDITQTEKDKVMRFGTWFVKRFEPVFLTHETILRTMCDKTPIADVDSMKKELKMKYLDNTVVPETVYKVGTSPFTKWSWFHHVPDPIHSSSKFVEEAAGAAREALLKEGVKKESAKAMAAIKPVTGNDKGPGTEAAKKEKIAHDQAAWGSSTTVRPGAKGPGATSISIIDALAMSKDPSGLTALQAVRMKAYGLIKLDMDKVRNILDLESAVLQNDIEIKAGAGATYKGDPAKALATFGARFGCHDDKTKAAWTNWFTGRFLGVLIQYVSSVQQASASAVRMMTTSTLNPENSLKPEQLLKIANDIVGAKGKVKGVLVSVWNIVDSPWPDYQMNDDSSLAQPNINALKDLVKEMEAKAPKSDGKKKEAKPAAASKGPSAAPSKGKVASKPGNAKSSISSSIDSSYNTNRAASKTAAGASVKANLIGGGASAMAATWKGGRDTFASKGPTTGGFVPASSVPSPPVDRGKAIAALRDAMTQGGITDPAAQANILANVQAESNFKPRSEVIKYSASRLCQVFPSHFSSLADAQQCVNQGPEAVANRIYGGRMGNGNDDGYKYRGRGYIQITGKDEYAQMAKLTGVDLVNNPDLANDPDVAAKIVVAYMKSRLSPDKMNDITAVTKAVGPADIQRQLAVRSSMAKNFLKGGAGVPGFTPHTGADQGAGGPAAVADTGGFKPNTGASPGATGKQPTGGFTPNSGAMPGTQPQGGPPTAFVPATPPPALTAPMPMAPVSGSDDVKVQRLNQNQVVQQTLADVSSRRAQANATDSSAQMIDLMSKQLAAQTSMDSSLKSVDTKLTSLLTMTGKQLDALAKVGSSGGSNTPGTTVSNGVNKPLQKAPNLPVSVDRPTPAQLAG